MKKQALEKLELLEELLLDSTRLPFSSSRLVDENEASEVIQEIHQALPSELTRSTEIIRNSNKIIEEANTKAEYIINKAKKERDRIVSKYEVDKIIEAKVKTILSKTHIKCQDMINEAKNESKTIEKLYKNKIEKLDKDFTKKQVILEKEYNNLKIQISNEYKQMKSKLNKQQAIDTKKANEELESLIMEKKVLIKELTNEYDELIIKSNNYKTNTRDYCEQMVNKAKSESISLKKDANNYVNSTLRQLERKLRDLTSIVSSGKEQIDTSKVNKDK